MKPYLLITAVAILISSCTSLKTSRYARYNKFTYASEQPDFNFSNDKLEVSGSWWWATFVRAIPKPGYLPDTIRKILKPLVNSHGPILFATWYPNHTKFRKAGYVPVTKADVRRTNEFAKPFYEVVLYSAKDFNQQSSYTSKGKTNDYQFDLYQSQPRLSAFSNYYVMETIAAGKDDYYTFIVIQGKSTDESLEKASTELFLEDSKLYFQKTTN